MADNSVFIAGVADGAFENALGALPPWATEKTAFTIEGILRKSLGIQTKLLSEAVKCCKGAGGGAGTISAEETKKVNNELDKLFRNLKRDNEEAAKTRKRNKELEQNDTQQIKDGKQLGGSSQKLTTMLTGLSAVGAKVITANTDYLDVYDSLYKSGINVLNGNNSTADGFEALNQLVNQTGMRLQTLQKVAEKYASTMNVVGISKFGKALAMSTTRMNELSFSQEESAEFTAAMIESERGYSNIRAKSASQISTDSIRLAQQFTRLSHTVGVSRQQLLDNLQKAAKTSESTMVAARHGEKAAASVAAAVAGFDDETKNMFLKMSASIDPVFTQMGKTFQMAGMGGLGTQIGRLSKDMQSMDPVAAQRSFESIVGSISPGDITALNARIAGGDADAAAALDMITKFQQHVRGLSKATEGQQDAATKTEASIARLQTQIEKAAALPQAMFFPLVAQVNLAADALTIFNNSLYGAIGAVEAETRSWIGVGIAIAGLIAGVLATGKVFGAFQSLMGGSIIKGIGSTLGGLGSMFLRFAGPVAALYAAFQLGTAIGETIYEAITGVKNSISYIEIIGQILSDIGTWFSGTFASVGKWVSDSMVSLQSGLNKIYEFAPWIETLVNFVSTFVKGVISKFGNKMSFGLIGSETSDFVNDPLKNQSAAETARLKRLSSEDKSDPKPAPIPKAPIVKDRPVPISISVPKTPMATTIDSPSAVEVQPPKVQDIATPARNNTVTTTMTTGDNTAGINNMLSFQSNLLEQILLSSTTLVSVNKEILRFTRNNA